MSNLPTQTSSSGLTTRRPRASVTLRDQGGQSQTMADLMDPANRSLADALRIAYRLLQGAIILMVVLYLASGYQQVEVGQSGVRLMFGRIQKENIEPGPNWSAPAPIGDMLRINTGVQKFQINEAFFPRLSSEEEKILADEKMREQGLNGGSGSLDPDWDGMLLTGDGSVVHARWQIAYKRLDDGRSLRNIADDEGDPEAYRPGTEDARRTPEQRLVAAIVRQAVVRVAAGMTIDSILAGSASAPSRDAANRMLDDLDVGISIDTIELTAKMPPRPLITNFNNVQSAQAEAAKTIEEARGQARLILSETAGDAASVLLSQIDGYEKQLATGERDAAEATLENIHKLMRRQSATIDGKPVDASLSGRVAQRVSEAEQYRTSVSTRAEADARVFEAKRQAYMANPSVFLSNEWTAAVQAFLRRDNVQTLAIPSTSDRTVLLINRDPELQRALEQERLQKSADEQKRAIDKAQIRSRFEGPVTSSGGEQ